MIGVQGAEADFKRTRSHRLPSTSEHATRVLEQSREGIFAEVVSELVLLSLQAFDLAAENVDLARLDQVAVFV